MEPIAATTSGKVRGFVEEETNIFLGVPFAAPPLGEHRFRAPVDPEPWDGTRDALRYGPTAPQRNPGATIIPEPVEPGEDFLNLNVFTPELGDAKLPVFVWIHGGGFVSGCNRSPWYRGTRFARDGVVVVCIGYRLGVEGFLEIEGAPSNRAVLDWVKGLEWVQENIPAFGGDPSNVTIGGQSAGSSACLVLMVNPKARGLFGRVIGMSGTSDSRMPPEAAAELGAKVAAHLGVRPTRDELASFTPDELVEAQAGIAANPFSSNSITRGFDAKAPALRPFADGEVIPEHPFRALRSGVAADVPLIAGSTTEELNGVVRMQRSSLEPKALSALASMGIDGERRSSYAAHVGTNDPVDLLAQATTDRAFREPLARLIEDRASCGAKTFAYQFGWPSPLFDGMVGAAHCLDIPFVFDNLDAERVADGLVGPNPPANLAEQMHGSWVSFIRDGDAGWPSYSSEYRSVMRFDVTSRLEDDPLRPLHETFARR
jgi:para-nitrobenzyl esterase